MASELGLPPPAKRPPQAPTTITDIGDDLLREIFVLLPSLPSLVRAAFACSTFLHAVRSVPAFRRRFQSLHRPQILGFFEEPFRTAIPRFLPLRRRSDPDLAAAVRGADFFLSRLPEDSADSSAGWAIESCHGGYVVLGNVTTSQIAAYNPFTHALDISPKLPEEIILAAPFLEFHTVISKEDHGVFHLVGVQHRKTSELRVIVLSSATREWQVLPWMDTPRPKEGDGPPPMPPQPEDDDDDDEDDMLTFHTGTQVNGFIYWKHASQAYVLVLNTATLQFSRLDVPVYLAETDSDCFKLGQTKDGEVCMAVIDDSDVLHGTLIVKFWGADDDGVEKWMLDNTFPICMFDDTTKPSTGDDEEVTVHIEAVIDGFVYLSTKYDAHTQSLTSICLEPLELNKLFDDTYTSPAFPYIMDWPPSLVYNKARLSLKFSADSQTKPTGVSI